MTITFTTYRTELGALQERNAELLQRAVNAEASCVALRDQIEAVRADCERRVQAMYTECGEAQARAARAEAAAWWAKAWKHRATVERGWGEAYDQALADLEALTADRDEWHETALEQSDRAEALADLLSVVRE